MYAVFRAGGKQYRASKGERLKLEKFAADEGAKVEFDEVLLVGEGNDIKVGSPLLSGSTVSAKVLRQGKSGKVSVTKFRRRQNYLRQHTHRQWFTEVEITGISGAASDKSTQDSTEAKAEEKSADQESGAKKAAGKKTAKKKATKKASKKTSKAAPSASTASGSTSKKKTAKKKTSS
jgi:large subunit ribosomal protein L21